MFGKGVGLVVYQINDGEWFDGIGVGGGYWLRDVEGGLFGVGIGGCGYGGVSFLSIGGWDR